MSWGPSLHLQILCDIAEACSYRLRGARQCSAETDPRTPEVYEPPVTAPKNPGDVDPNRDRRRRIVRPREAA